MNIGYLINFNWYPPSGGARVHAYQVAHQLSQKGHKIKTIHYWDQAPGLEVYRQRQLFKFIRDIDVLYIRIHGDWSFEHFSFLRVLKFFRLPIVWEINSPLEELIVRGMRTQKQVNQMNARRRFFGSLVNTAVCVSSGMQEYASQFLKIKNTIVVPNGSDPEQFTPNKRSDQVYMNLNDKFKVLWSGSAEYSWQGVNMISKIAEKVYAVDKDIEFIIVTDLKHIDQSKFITKNITFIDKKPYLEIPPYLASADLGLCLYENYGWNGKFYFSPLKLFDYMASGLPVIASNIGQIEEVIVDGENGLLTNNDPEDIAQKIVRIKNDSDFRKNLGANARKEIERYYNWERVATETEKILQNLN